MTLNYFNENNKSPSRMNAETLHEALGDINLTEGEIKSLNWLRDYCEPSTVQNIVSVFKKAGQAMHIDKTVITPEDFNQPNSSITPEREDELRELFNSETNEDWTQEWRDSLNGQEQRLVDKWDTAYAKGVKNICEKIIEKSPPAPQMF